MAEIVLLVEPCPPAFLLLDQHRDDMGDGPGVVVGRGVASGVGPSAPHPRLHRPPERNRLRDNIRAVDVNEDGVGADDVAYRR